MDPWLIVENPTIQMLMNKVQNESANAAGLDSQNTKITLRTNTLNLFWHKRFAKMSFQANLDSLQSAAEIHWSTAFPPTRIILYFFAFHAADSNESEGTYSESAVMQFLKNNCQFAHPLNVFISFKSQLLMIIKVLLHWSLVSIMASRYRTSCLSIPLLRTICQKQNVPGIGPITYLIRSAEWARQNSSMADQHNEDTSLLMKT